MFVTIIAFIAVLSILVFVHELGHFWTARKFGLKPEEFGFGFPPRAWGIYRSKAGGWKQVKGSKQVEDAEDTIYSLNWIPMGGFVKLGEDDDPGTNQNHFNSKKIWQRAVILLAGVTMNIILAAFLIFVGYLVGLPQALDDLGPGARVENRQIQVAVVYPDTPAQEAGIKAGDVIESIDGREFDSGDGLITYVNENTGQELNYRRKRAGEDIDKKVTPVLMEETGKGGIGIAIAETGEVKYPFYIAIWEAVKLTLFLTWAIIVAFYDLISGLLVGNGVGADVAGPVGIAALTGQVARLGFVYILQFTALLSINLAIINALPFPALDGGRVIFLIIEKIKGRPVRKELEGTIHYIGFALLMILVVIVTFKDVARYSDWFRNIIERIT
jgi:regulator of sigma E protease